MESFKNDIINGITEGIKTKCVDGVKWLGITIIDNSYNVCLVVAMIGLICYLGGYKKGAKVVTLSLIVYFVLQAIKVVLL